MIIHDAKCPYWDQVSLNNTKPKTQTILWRTGEEFTLRLSYGIAILLKYEQDIVLQNENWISDFTEYQLVSKITIWPSQKMLWFVIYLKFRACDLLFFSKGRISSVSLTSQLFQRKCILLSLENIYKLYYEFCQQDAGTNLSDQVRRWFAVLFTSNIEVCDLDFPSNWRGISSTSQLFYWKCAH